MGEAPTILRIHANSTAGDLNGYFVVVNGGETSAPIDVYSSAAALKVILENMLTVSYVDVTVTDHALATGSAPSNYGRTWEVTFTNGRANAVTLSPVIGQYRSPSNN